eukprot:gnl/Chilomastix_cuspidata/2603.p1 GENE.gnl/Chilomastix_cuspidata/2603~~gnl/Chilomastix_cuspidata/2603.p1  ORF type:complete len:416 (+),score=149.59 gnl/Chilomastix_cuspidata/2603:33-1250(+)
MQFKGEESIDTPSVPNYTVDREQFEAALREIYESSLRRTIITDEYFDEILTTLKNKEVSEKGFPDPKGMNRDRILHRFKLGADGESIFVYSGHDRPPREVVKYSRIYDVLYETHNVKGDHAGINPIMKLINASYIYVPRAAAEKYASMCEVCAKKRLLARQTPEPAATPGSLRLFSHFNDLHTIGVIEPDLGELPPALASGCTRVLAVRDFATQLVWLEPLHTNTAEEVKARVLRVYARTGLPACFALRTEARLRRDVTAFLVKLGARKHAGPKKTSEPLANTFERTARRVEKELARAIKTVAECEAETPLPWEVLLPVAENRVNAAAYKVGKRSHFHADLVQLRFPPADATALLLGRELAPPQEGMPDLTGISSAGQFPALEAVLEPPPMFRAEILDGHAPATP